jgi:FMN reductase [NAD(P)H]
MNDTLKLLQTHHSIRSYTDIPVSDEMLDQIIRAAWHGPTSMNAQEVSLVVTRDAQQRARIAELAGGQPWIAQAPVFIRRAWKATAWLPWMPVSLWPT